MKHILTVVAVVLSLTTFAQKKGRLPEVGIVADMKYDSLLYAQGYRSMVESVQNFISPIKFSDEAFEKHLSIVRALKTKIYAVNIFMPGDLKLVGPELNEQKVLDYSRVVIARCKRAGITMIIWGSGGARRVPEGFDPATARQQFVSLAKKVAAQAKDAGIMIALENLNSTETNFINTVKDALEVVRLVDHPNFRLCVDIYHMLKDGEPPAVIAQTKNYLVHCDIAEGANRTPPGVVGDDFRPYLTALKDIGYTRLIVLECRWDNFGQQAGPARTNLLEQMKQAYR